MLLVPNELPQHFPKPPKADRGLKVNFGMPDQVWENIDGSRTKFEDEGHGSIRKVLFQFYYDITVEKVTNT